MVVFASRKSNVPGLITFVEFRYFVFLVMMCCCSCQSGKKLVTKISRKMFEWFWISLARLSQYLDPTRVRRSAGPDCVAQNMNLLDHMRTKVSREGFSRTMTESPTTESSEPSRPEFPGFGHFWGLVKLRSSSTSVPVYSVILAHLCRLALTRKKTIEAKWQLKRFSPDDLKS